MLELTIAILGGFVAGMINTLAGNGSAITLTIFTEILGLPPNVANGTNRIGIMAQAVTGSWVFYKNDRIKKDEIWSVVIPFIPGALLGVYVATQVSNEQFKSVFTVLLVVLLLLILVKPKRWFQPELFKVDTPGWLKTLLFFGLGFYGGFIQMGMGIFFLATLVLIMRFNITQANVVKIIVVGIYTSFVLLIFHWKGLVDWQMGALVAIGQATGGWLTARWAIQYPWMEKVTYYLLVVIISVAIVSLVW